LYKRPSAGKIPPKIERVILVRIDAVNRDRSLTRESDSVKEDNQVSMDEVDVQAIQNKVIEIISEQMGVDKSEITRDTSFINDLNADSLDTVELVMEFEDEFDMSIPDEEAEKIQTVGAAIDYIVNIAQSKKKESA
jgi:acyl carrier protein